MLLKHIGRDISKDERDLYNNFYYFNSSDHGSGARYWLITLSVRVRFPNKSSGFFQITTIFRRRCKAVTPGYYLVVVVRSC
jgi:hypothetical protein